MRTLSSLLTRNCGRRPGWSGRQRELGRVVEFVHRHRARLDGAGIADDLGTAECAAGSGAGSEAMPSKRSSTTRSTERGHPERGVGKDLGVWTLCARRWDQLDRLLP